MKNSMRSDTEITMENTCHRDAILCYCELTPCVVSKDTKEEKCTAVGEKVCLGMKRC